MPPAPSPHVRIRYRPHIDGLRAIAVLAVVLEHAGLGLSGGFIGVDVFFVISGFLITSIILRDLKTGAFSLAGFWERRVRRIFPALIAVMAACIIAAHFFMLYKPDYFHFGTTVMAQSIFASNILFMKTDNYFDQPSHYSPLLHTWSLAVEEQFYVLFPLVVMACIWLSRRFWHSTRFSILNGGERLLLIGTIAIVIGSFALNTWFIDIRSGTALEGPFFPHAVFSETTFATAGFYVLPTRAWELGLGIIAALLSVGISSVVLAEAVSIAGLAAIITAAFAYTDATPYPGVAALAPTLGALAIIVANERRTTKIGALLSTRILVWIGLISYSLYLWHWPLFVFAKLASPVPLNGYAMAGLSVLAVFIAWLSYDYIETPFRLKTFLRSRTKVFAFGFGAMALLAIIGYAIHNRNFLYSSSIPEAANETLALIASAQSTEASHQCFQFPGDEQRYGGLCRIGSDDPSAKPSFVLWGDSHALAITPLLDSLAKRYGMQGVVFDGGSCLPLPGVWTVPESDSCESANANALQYIRDNSDVRAVFLAANWGLYVMGGPDGKRLKLITDSAHVSHSADDATAVFHRHLGPLVEQMTSEGKAVYIMEQVPDQFDFDPRSAFYQSVHTRQKIAIQGISASTSAEYMARPNSIINELASLPGVHVLNPSTVMCSDRTCPMRQGDTLLYADDNHLSKAGAMNLEPLFIPAFRTMSSGNYNK